MSESNGAIVMVFGAMSLMSSSVFVPIVIALGIWVYKKYVRDELGKYVTADWTEERMLLPPEAREDTDNNCAYFYNYATPWESENGKGGGITTSSKWCIDDGVNVHTPIWEAKKIHGDGIGHNQTDYIRLGKNVNITLWDNHSNEEGFKGTGNEKRYLGGDYGLGKLIRLSQGVKQDDLDAFQIDKKL